MIHSIDELLTLVIHAKHGWAVSEQFEETWNGRDFDDVNPNALENIVKTLTSLEDGDILSDESKQYIEEYLDKYHHWKTLDPDWDRDDDLDEMNPINEQKQKILKEFKRYL